MPVLLDETPAQFRLTQRSTDAQQVTRTSTRAQDCPASINFAKNGEADYDRGVLCRVAPGELQPESSGSASHAPEEVVKPLAGAGGPSVRKKHFGRAPIAAMSLVARARALYPTTFGGCAFRRK